MLWYGQIARRKRYRPLVVLTLATVVGLAWSAWPTFSNIYQKRHDVRVLRTLCRHNEGDVLVSTEKDFRSRAINFPSDYAQKGMLSLSIKAQAREVLSRFEELPPSLPVLVFVGSRATYLFYLEQPGFLLDDEWEYELACYEIIVPLVGSSEVKEMSCDAVLKFPDRNAFRIQFAGYDASSLQERFKVSIQDLGTAEGSQIGKFEFVIDGNGAVFKASDTK